MNEKTIIYFVRHAECTGNKEKRLCGKTDFKLSNMGKMQAKNLGNYMKNIPLDIIFSSPLSRTKETAENIQKYNINKLQIKTVSNFQEVYFGILDGKLHSEAQNHYKKEMLNWTLNKRYPEGLPEQEKIEDAQKRFLKALNNILENNDYKSICIVTHGTILRSVI